MFHVNVNKIIGLNTFVYLLKGILWLVKSKNFLTKEFVREVSYISNGVFTHFWVIGHTSDGTNVVWSENRMGHLLIRTLECSNFILKIH